MGALLSCDILVYQLPGPVASGKTGRAGPAGSCHQEEGRPDIDNATMLAELLPTAERLVDRHMGMAKEWFPHDLVECGRPPPEIGCAEPLPDGVASAVFVNVLTEDNLPYYFASIDNLFGRDGASSCSTRRWTAEEGRHSIVLRDYLVMSGHIDPVNSSAPGWPRSPAAFPLRP